MDCATEINVIQIIPLLAVRCTPVAYTHFGRVVFSVIPLIISAADIVIPSSLCQRKPPYCFHGVPKYFQFTSISTVYLLFWMVYKILLILVKCTKSNRLHCTIMLYRINYMNSNTLGRLTVW